MSDLVRLLTLASVPRDSLPTYGRQVGHSPEREGQDPATCAECGGGPDPVKVYGHHIDERGNAWLAPLTVVCGGCGRTRHDGTPALWRAVKPESGRLREGYQAPAPDVDPADRTGAAVQGPKPEPDRPLTRKEKRAALYGPQKPPGGA